MEKKERETKGRGFAAGWQQLRLMDCEAVKNAIMKTLGVTTEASFRLYKTGHLVPDQNEAEEIENIFRTFGVSRDIWGAATA